MAPRCRFTTARRAWDWACPAGWVLSVADDSFEVAAEGGSIRVMRVRPQGGKKMDAGEFARAAGVSAGKRLGV